MIHHGCTYKPLFLKPLFYPGTTVTSRFIDWLQKTISFRSFNLATDLDLVHSWVNMEYTQAFWQLGGNKQRLYDLYYSIQRNSNGHSYLGMLDQQPVCQFDVYRVLADEIRTFIPADEHDCGFHLLMAPNTVPVPGLTLSVVQTWLDYYFSFPEAARMYAEPDIRNDRSNRLLGRAGFRFLQQIGMSYKTANLYSITKEQFHESSPFHLSARKQE